MLEYKGFIGEAEVDPDAGVIHGRLVGIRAVITFESETAAGLKAAFQDSVDDYLAWCAERAKEPERPFSGRFVVRIRPELHRDLVMAARRSDESLNAFAERALGAAVGFNVPDRANRQEAEVKPVRVKSAGSKQAKGPSRIKESSKQK